MRIGKRMYLDVQHCCLLLHNQDMGHTPYLIISVALTQFV